MKMLSRLISLGVFLPLFSEAAIIFRPISPGEISDNTGTVLLNNIDIDDDGIVDFFTTSAGGQATLVPTGNNRVLSEVAILPDLGRSISTLVGSEIIGANPIAPMSWNGLADRVNPVDNGGSFIYMCNARGPIGQPPVCNSRIPGGSEIRFVGLELEKDGNLHYGWVAISAELTTLHNVTVNSWAYETEANTAILAGAVPEPSSSLLITMWACFLFKRKRIVPE